MKKRFKLFEEFVNSLEESANVRRQVDDFTWGYIVAALWSSSDEDGDNLDDNYGPEDLAPETLKQMIKNCKDFQNKHKKELAGIEPESAGHNYWLSQAGHGAGFFDMDGVDDDIREKLQKAAEKGGEMELYVGDDGLIYA